MAFFTADAFSQKAFFADGYHGGVYGHYPPWVTQFMVDQLKDHPDWKINLEIEPETWDWAETNTPAAYSAFKQIFDTNSANPRIEYANPAYAQSYLWNISGESVIRQFAYGIAKIRDHFPNARFTTYSSEEPCFTSALPGILKSFGFEYAVLKNPNTCWGGYTRSFGGELVNWIGPDGTAMTTVPKYEIEALQSGSTWQTIAVQNSTDYLKAALQYGIAQPVGMCFQDAGWRIGPWLGDGRHTFLPSEYVTWSDYIRKASSLKPPSQDWRLSQEDVQVSLVWGSQILQQLAQHVRTAENRLLIAEKMAALAHFYAKSPWPKSSLDEAWRNLLLSEHHDCWIVPYNRHNNLNWADHVSQWTGETRKISDTVIQQSLAALSGGFQTNGQTAIRVFNTLGTERNALATVLLPVDWDHPNATILDSHGKPLISQEITLPGTNSKALLFQAQVPSLGCATYRLEKTNASQPPAGANVAHQSDGTYKLETDLYTIILDPEKGGAIKSLLDKSLKNMEWVDITNSRSFNEIRGYFWEDEKFYSSADNPATITILENGPLRVRVEIKGKIGLHPVTQLITVSQHQPRIDFQIKIDWQGNPGIGSEYAQSGHFKSEDNQKAFYDDRYKLQALFPLNLKSQKIYKNAPFDVTESKLTNTFFTTWDNIKNNIILNWVDVVSASNSIISGMTLLSDHTTSYEHGADYPLGLTLQYSGMGLWAKNYPISGPTEVSYAVIPHSKKWDQAKIWTADDEWNEPLLTTLFQKSASTNNQNSLLNTAGSGFEVSALLVDGRDLLIRLFNAEGDSKPKKLDFDGPVIRVDLIKLNGERIETLPTKRDKSGRTTLEIAMPKFGIRTLRFVLR